MANARTIAVQIEFTPLGRALMRLAYAVASADRALIPPEVNAAALDVCAIAEEHGE